MFQKLLSPARWSADATDAASFVLRLSLGLLMLTHGYPKLMTLLSGDMKFADPIGIGEPASLVLTVFAEFVCSLLLVVGLWTRLALIPLMFTMIIAVSFIHFSDGMDKKEHALMYLLPYVALFLLGSGKFSLDAFLKKEA
jgi:putative oxidoreductase